MWVPWPVLCQPGRPRGACCSRVNLPKPGPKSGDLPKGLGREEGGTRGVCPVSFAGGNDSFLGSFLLQLSFFRGSAW